MTKVKLTRLDEVPLSEIFFEMLSIARRNKVILEANFTTLIIGTVVIEGNPPPLLRFMVGLVRHPRVHLGSHVRVACAWRRPRSTARPRSQSPAAGGAPAGEGPGHSGCLHQGPPLGSAALALPSDVRVKRGTVGDGQDPVRWRVVYFSWIGQSIAHCIAGAVCGFAHNQACVVQPPPCCTVFCSCPPPQRAPGRLW